MLDTQLPFLEASLMVNPLGEPMVPTSSADNVRRRSVGRNVQTLHEMVDHRRHRVVLADDLAPGKFSTSEHHLDTEGVEALRNNGFTFANHAARTNDIKLIPMSIAPITINPIRAATGMAPRDAFQSNLNFEAYVAPFAPVPHWTEAW
jgi:hypothetical protein